MDAIEIKHKLVKLSKVDIDRSTKIVILITLLGLSVTVPITLILCYIYITTGLTSIEFVVIYACFILLGIIAWYYQAFYREYL